MLAAAAAAGLEEEEETEEEKKEAEVETAAGARPEAWQQPSMLPPAPPPSPPPRRTLRAIDRRGADAGVGGGEVEIGGRPRAPARLTGARTPRPGQEYPAPPASLLPGWDYGVLVAFRGQAGEQ